MFGPLAGVSYATSPLAACDGADALVVVTEWKEFRGADFEVIRSRLKSPLIFDGRNLYDPAHVKAAGLEYFAIGRRPPAEVRHEEINVALDPSASRCSGSGLRQG